MITLMVLLSMLFLAGLVLAGPWTAMQVGLSLLLAGFALFGALASGLLGALFGLLVGLAVIGLVGAGALLALLLALPALLLAALGLALLGAAPLLLPLALLLGLVWLLVHASRRPAPTPLRQLPAA
jgi:hypothetical protein